MKSAQRGFTLIELMVSLVLGLLVVGAAGSLFLSNRKVYGNTESVNRIQENQRSAYEMLARDVREAGGNPCTRNVVNMLDTSKPGGSYYTGWLDGISGADGTGANGSDEITLSQANGAAINVTGNDTPSANIDVTSTTGLADNDIVMVCNSEVAAIFQATSLPSGSSIQHNSGSGTPGNLAKPFQIDQKAFDNSVGGTNAPGYCFLPPATGANPNCLNPPSGSPAQVVKPYAVRWYLAANTRGGTSLYRQVVTNGGASVQTAGEIAEGVTGMQISYKVGTTANYVDASAVTAAQWKLVTAVRAQLRFQAVQGALSSNDIKGTDNANLTRTLDDYIVLRNHMDIQ
ncbi:PilW family protein [Thermomonas sp. HDW16]|uniref:PilW family protein n=1 Tax=Thermomonas sp. HDW16 TaxID=2714945 RepID=UPI00140F2B4C|nr:PilW family protein [Thermomonas sp. HDW16]QIL20169.1 prepilin-type N-terminal cleavage/methylation domain-containing protein [Thermomonas sp. HDW16]